MIIKILNYRNNCVISTSPLVVLFGQLQIKLEDEKKDEFLNCKYLNRDYKCKLIGYQNNYKFKFIFLLKKGLNEFKFSYHNHYELKFNLNYNRLPIKRFLRIIYCTCSKDKNNKLNTIFDEGRFQNYLNNDNSIESAKKRIALALLMLQTFLSSTLPSKNTFDLELDENNLPIVNLYHLEQFDFNEYKLMNQDELYRNIAIEILKSNYFNLNCKYLIFISFSRFNFNENLIKNKNKINYKELISMQSNFVALGGGNLAAISTCELFSWPETIDEIEIKFNDETVIDNRFKLNNCDLSTSNSLYLTSLGTVMHEACHTFDLGHDVRGIMDREFEFIKNFFINNISTNEFKYCWSRPAFLILLNHKFLNKNLKYMDDDECEVEQMNLVDNNDNLIKYKNFTFDKIKSNLISKNGIILIEYRDFDSYTIKFLEYNLPRKLVNLSNDQLFKMYKNKDENELIINYIIFMDCCGNILKFN